MEQSPKYYIVEASALPEIFQKVAEAKRMLETGETDKVNVAAQAVGISRSAFYKYRDSIAPFQNLMAGRIITFQMMLKDKAGVLSEILAIFANCGANILTINQSIPTGGRAMVTISAETSNLRGADPEDRRKERRSQGGLRRGINHACISILRTHRDRIRRRQRQQAAGAAEEAEAFARARRLRRLEREKERIA